MGNAQITDAEYKVASALEGVDVGKKERTAQEEDDHILKKIIDLSNTLWNEYNENFLDKDFCNNVAIAYMDRLGKLPIKDLRNIYDNNNSAGDDDENGDALQAVLSYNPKGDEQFVVNELKGQLTEYFLNNEVDLAYQEENNPDINVSVKGMKYINPRTKDALEGKFGRGFNRRTRGRNQKGGANNDDITVNSLLANIDSLKNIENVKNNKNNKSHSNSANTSASAGSSNTNVGSGSSSGTGNANSGVGANVGNKPSLGFNDLEQELKNLEMENKNKNKANNKKNNKKNGNSNGNGNGNGKKNKGTRGNKGRKGNNDIEELLKLTSENAGKKNMGDPLAKAKVITENVENLTNVLKNKMQNDGKHPNFQNSDLFKSCSDPEKPCKLTKKEICKKITQHYIVRGNIIAAILTFLPHKDRKSGRYIGGFCHNRLVSLEKGTYCLPPDVRNLRGMETRDVVKKLLEYANNFSKGKCAAANGHFMTLNPGEMKSLKSSGSQYNAYYFRYTQKLQMAYKNTMNELYKILVILSEMKSINNKDLEALSLKVKDHLDMGMKLCQYNYIAALISLIQADLTDRNSHLQEVSQSLEKGLK